MEYFVADSFTGWELVEAPYEKNGKMYTKARTTCDRCYKGMYVTRVENGVPVPHPNYGGVCLKCNGAGYLTKEIRLYTEKEKEAAVRAKERALFRKEEEKLSIAAEKKAKWLEKEGFGINGTTTIYIAADSYEKKDELKAAGWKYSTTLGWHIAPENIVNEYPSDKVITLQYEDLASFNVYGEGFWLDTAKNYVDQIKLSHQPQSLSEWIGAEKEKISNLAVVIKKISGFEGKFGWTNIISFLNGENEIVWFTSSNINFSKGEACLLSATIKEHKTYQNRKQTVITRAKLS